MNFNTFKVAVQKQFDSMQKHSLFRVDMGDVDLNQVYLQAFPEGSNPIFRERTKHDCSCCKQFIRSIGNVVSVIDGVVVSIWDIKIPSEPAYEVVAKALSKIVKTKSITNIYIHYEKHVGTDKNFEQTISGAKAWEHFFVNLDSKFVVNKDSIGTTEGGYKAAYDVTLLGLKEITNDSISTVLDLISQNSLYRGEEHKNSVTSFKTLKAEFDKSSHKEIFVWNYVSNNSHTGRIRNTVIGSLLTDLSDGVDLEKAVKSFEGKVTPANYKRPTALVTQKMINAAKETIEALGYTSSLERRYATIDDITINNVLFANRSLKKRLSGDVFDTLKATAPSKTKELKDVQEITIDKFLKDVLPTATSVEVMLENSHKNNLVSLIAPANPTSANMFKWGNKFSWSYTGDFADSIKERVKAAGGNVTGDLCCRLSWDYTDDLDFHMHEPNGYHLNYSNRYNTSTNGGRLDVDANGGSGMMAEPVENIFYANRATMKDGSYKLVVNNYTRRSDGIGFTVQIECDGQVQEFSYDKVIRTQENVSVATIIVENGVFTITSDLSSSTTSKTFWGIDTNKWVDVKSVMLSPNFWDEQEIGNKHYFFMLDGCKNGDVARGFYNEFLSPELDKNRKVLEMVGSKLKTDNNEFQLSGVGFSSTQKNSSIVCRVKGSFTRTFKIVF